MSETLPLITDPNDNSTYLDTTNRSPNMTRHNRLEKKKTYLQRNNITGKLLLFVMIACFGAVQFGYHMGELNAPQKYMTCNYTIRETDAQSGNHHFLKTCVKMSDQEYSIITAIFSIGGLFGSFHAGNLANVYGRKKLSIINAMVSLLGSLVLSVGNNFWEFIVGRLLVGIAAGSSIVVVTLIINEISPPNLKGVFGSMNQGSINFGILINQFLSLFWARPKVWRYLFLSGTAIAAVQLILLFTIFEETPKWLFNNGDLKKSEKLLRQLRATSKSEVRQEIEQWKTKNGTDNSASGRGNRRKSVSASKSRRRSLRRRSSVDNGADDDNDTHPISFKEYVTGSQYWRSKFLITVILVGQQFAGINSIILYGVRVISNLVENPRIPIKVNFGISIINVLITFGASPLIDRLGRKPLIISSAFFMGIFAFLIAWSLNMEKPYLLISMIFAYIGAFAIGVGPIPFLVIPELSKPEALGAAQSYGTVCNWIGTFIVAYGFPVLSNAIGVSTVFTMFALFAIVFAVYLYYNLPETKGKSSFNEVWGINVDHQVDNQLENGSN